MCILFLSAGVPVLLLLLPHAPFVPFVVFFFFALSSTFLQRSIARPYTQRQQHLHTSRQRSETEKQNCELKNVLLKEQRNSPLKMKDVDFNATGAHTKRNWMNGFKWLPCYVCTAKCAYSISKRWNSAFTLMSLSIRKSSTTNYGNDIIKFIRSIL